MNFLSNLISGLSLGRIYALIALGYTMVYGIAKMLNFAHGDVIMVGAFTVIVAVNSLGLPAVAGILVSVLVCVVMGVLIERIAYKPLRSSPSLSVLITAIGVSYFLQSLALLIFGSTQKSFPKVFTMEPMHFGELTVKGESVETLAVTVIIMIALTLFINKTKMGKAMRAVSEDRDAAELMGISVNKTITVTFAIGSALAAFASMFYLFQIPTTNPTLGAMPGITAFTAAVIGGIGSIPGAMVGGVLLGVIEKFCLVTPLASYTTAIKFTLLIVILLFRPTGLMGKVTREKV